MLSQKDIHRAIEVLITYESAYVQNLRKNSDINEGLFWDEENQCFSMDFGMCLRGEAEDVRIYKGVDDYIRYNSQGINHYEASVIYGGEIYFFEAGPFVTAK